MTRPLVAITQRRDLTGPPHDEVRDALDVRLGAFVLAAGALPLPVPSALGPADLAAWLTATGFDAMLLAGGGDIGTDATRDRIEAALVNHAMQGRLPLLGICRGMQMLAHIAGTETVKASDHVATRHMLTGPITQEVNSYHAQAIPTCPPGYHTLATAPDGTIEAMQHTDLPFQGWMWHPERDTPFATADIARFKEMLS